MSEQSTVFLIDDDAGMLASLQFLIESDGQQVETFSSAEPFIERFNRGQHGCVVSDVKMPGLSGIQLQQQMKTRDWQIPMIFISGHSDIPIAVEALHAGAFDFMPKPVDGEKLLERIRSAIVQDESARKENKRRQAVLQRLACLTEREEEVLNHLIKGVPLKRIALRLEISIQAVARHRAKILHKMRVKNDAELIRDVLTSRSA